MKFEGERKRIADKLEKILHPIEVTEKHADEPDQFRYEASHLVCHLPTEFRSATGIDFVELQVCTLFQHAWAEADHDVGYKPNRELTYKEKRLKAVAAASAWGADQTFQALLDSMRQ